MQMNIGEVIDLSELTPEQRDFLLNGSELGGKKISMLSQFANIKRKDYVEYNNKQMAIYNLLNG